jgi:hypothetical protein
MEVDNKILKKLAKTIINQGWVPGPNWSNICRYCGIIQSYRKPHEDDCAIPLAEKLLENLKNI